MDVESRVAIPSQSFVRERPKRGHEVRALASCASDHRQTKAESIGEMERVTMVVQSSDFRARCRPTGQKFYRILRDE